MTMVGLMSAQFSKPLVASKATHLCMPQIQKVSVCKKLAEHFTGSERHME